MATFGNIELLEEYVQKGYISKKKHETLSLWIYNYTQLTQWEGFWNEITINARGLILDADYTIIHRCLPKFFNYEELDKTIIPSESFEVFEKMDGSYGVLYWNQEEPCMATRGSFISDQAIEATTILQENYLSVAKELDKSKTYIFEIIYPGNQIVVNYEGMRDLVLLAIIDTETGINLPLQDIGFPVVKQYNGITDFTSLKELERSNAEGFVVKFKNGFRMKIKFTDYVRLHRIMTGVSNIAIWEYLAENKSLDELIDNVPDEFYNYVRKTVNDLKDKYAEIENSCKEVFKEFATRKETAEYFSKQNYKAILFLMLDKKDYYKAIYKLIRPTFQKPFFLNEE